MLLGNGGGDALERSRIKKKWIRIGGLKVYTGVCFVFTLCMVRPGNQQVADSDKNVYSPQCPG